MNKNKLSFKYYSFFLKNNFYLKYILGIKVISTFLDILTDKSTNSFILFASQVNDDMLINLEFSFSLKFICITRSHRLNWLQDPDWAELLSSINESLVFVSNIFKLTCGLEFSDIQVII